MLFYSNHFIDVEPRNPLQSLNLSNRLLNSSRYAYIRLQI